MKKIIILILIFSSALQADSNEFKEAAKKATSSIQTNTEKLFTAIKSKQITNVKLFLENGANPNAKEGWEENTPLNIAAKIGSIEIVKLLLQYGANPNLKDNWKNTPINTAARNDNIEIVKLLLQHGANPNERAPWWGETPLHDAVKNGNIPMIKLLLQHGARADIPTLRAKEYEGGLAEPKYEELPIDWAALYKQKEAAKLLFQSGQKFDTWNALRIALNKRDLEMLKVLIENGADTKGEYSFKGATLLDLAYSYKVPKEIITYLKSKGAPRTPYLKRITRGGDRLWIGKRRDLRPSVVGSQRHFI